MATTTQKRTIYNGELSLIFNPKARNRYLVTDGLDSNSPVGVTTVLSKVLNKEALVLWPMYEALKWLREHPNDFEGAETAHRKKSDKGKDVGTEVHEAIELLLKESLPHRQYDGLSPQAKKAVDAFGEWLKANRPEVLATEQIVYSKTFNYAGTFDALLEIGGKTYLCDVKTSNASRTAPLGIYPEYFLQLAAYSLAYREERSFKTVEGNLIPIKSVDGLMVINASKTGKLSVLKASDLGLSLKDCERAWLSVLNTYKFLEPIKRTIKEMQ